MSKSNVVDFFEYLQKNEQMQEQLQDEFKSKGQVSVENLLGSAEAVGLIFTEEELHAVVKEQVEAELDDEALDQVVGGVFNISQILASSFAGNVGDGTVI